MSSSTINAKNVQCEKPLEKDDISLIFHIGVFFDGSTSEQKLSSRLATNYEPEVSETIHKYTIVIPDAVTPNFDEHFDEDGAEKFGKRLAVVIEEVYRQLSNLLSGFYDRAPKSSIKLDVFCVEDGFFAASVLCEAITPNCFDNKPPYVDWAICDYVGGGILEDFRRLGADVEINSVTTFQIFGQRKDAKTASFGQYRRAKESETDKKRQGTNEEESVTKGLIPLSDGPDFDTDEPIKMSQDRTFFSIVVKDSSYPGLYSSLCDIEGTLENVALGLDIVALTLGATGIGLPVASVCEVFSMSLNGVNAIICVGLAGMAGDDKELRDKHLQNAGWNAVGVIPFGSIIGKSAKGAKFACNRHIVEWSGSVTTASQKATKLEVDKLHPKDGPYFKVIKNSTPKVEKASEEAALTARSNFKVIQGGKIEGEYKYKVNGAPEFVANKTFMPNVVVNSTSGFRMNNYLNIGLSGGGGSAVRVGRSGIKGAISQGDKKVEPVSNIKKVEFNVQAMNSDSQRQNIIKVGIEYIRRYLAMLRFKKLLQEIRKGNKAIYREAQEAYEIAFDGHITLEELKAWAKTCE